MNTRFWHRLLLALFILLSTRSSNAVAQEVPGLLDRHDLDEDNRLNSKISLTRERIYLRDLLAMLGRLSDVSITMNTDEVCATTPIFISVHSTPLDVLLNNVSSLLSYRKAQFRWTKNKEDGKFVYRLHTREFEVVPATLQRQARELFKEQFDLVTEMAAMRPEDRGALKSKLAKSMLEDNDRAATTYLSNDPLYMAYWDALKFFGKLVDQNQLGGIMAGQPATLKITDMPGDVSAGLLRYFQPLKNVTNQNGEIEAQTAQSVTFRYIESMYGRKRLFPQMRMEFKTEKTGASINMVGFTGKGMKRRIQNSWLLPGDTLMSDLERKQIGDYDEKNDASALRVMHRLERGLLAASTLCEVSIVAVLPDTGRNHRISPARKQLAIIIAELEGQPDTDLIHKWRGDMLLINYPEWFYGDDALCPVALIDVARQAERKHGYLPFPSIVHLAFALTDMQRKRVAEELPAVEMPHDMIMLGQIYKAFPAVYSARGIAVDAMIYKALQQTSLGAAALAAAKSAEIRVQDKRITAEKNVQDAVVFETRLDGGEWKTIRTFAQPRRPITEEIEKRTLPEQSARTGSPDGSIEPKRKP